MDRIGAQGIVVVVVGIVLDAAGHVPLAQRGPLARNRPGEWENPGGAVEPGECFEEAVRREIREELGIEVAVEGLLRVADHVIPGAGLRPAQRWASPTLVCRHVSGTPRIGEAGKCSAVGWFDLDHLPVPMAAVSRSDLECYRRLLETGGHLQPAE